ncbi:hypothetical protein [Bradyrhizobium sp. 2S1]|uniref:hypothetical protein n=1 Tax=Bradyrhizobium sp. 2S1 TaxID=1404429 RepID=UPI00140ADD2E|nr:hypothetical protein [Bradyrhizobium sp. 2S1]MCK7669375.1 hypothetical protein [Bradyrhizobium sp. 2S1]
MANQIAWRSHAAMHQRRYTKWSGHFPAGSPVDWIAAGHVTCSIQCHGCSRMADVTLDSLPQDRPWTRIGWYLICSVCGATGSVNIVPNWHDMKRHAVPFSPGWRSR